MNKIVFIGCGAVGFCLLEVFKLEGLYYNCDFVIIEPKKSIKDLKEIMENRNYVHIKKAVTRENCSQLLKDIDEHTFIINVSVNVDSIMLLRLAKEHKSWYIDTSLEQYEDTVDDIPLNKIKNYSQFKKNNLYHQNLEAFKAIGKSRKTRIISGGMNPGFISEYAKRTVKEYAKSKGKSITKSNYAKVAHELGLLEIQIVEYDSQKLRIKATPKKFVNTWSAVGFQEEAADFAMLSLNNNDLKEFAKEYKLIKPIEPAGDSTTHIRFIAEYGMNLERESITLDYNGKPFKYTGFIVPHAEIVSMTKYFQYRGDAPTIMYVYRPCDEALKSLDFFRKNEYELLPQEVVVRGKDIISGWDSIGTLLTFENGDKFGGWTICGVEDTKRIGIKSGPTCLQVCAFMNSAIKWSLKNPNKGLVNSEQIPHKFIFKHGQKYMGKTFFKKV